MPHRNLRFLLNMGDGKTSEQYCPPDVGTPYRCTHWSPVTAGEIADLFQKELRGGKRLYYRWDFEDVIFDGSRDGRFLYALSDGNAPPEASEPIVARLEIAMARDLTCAFAENAMPVTWWLCVSSFNSICC